MYKMPRDESSEDVARRADRHQRRADGLSDFRRHAARPIGFLSAVGGPNWLLAAAATVAGPVTDRLDGDEAREAARLRGTPTTKEGSERDHKADKAYVNNLIGGLAVGAFLKGHYRTGSVLTVAQVANLARDKAMQHLREDAEQEGKDTKAIPINKLKTGVLMVGGILSLAPIAEGHRGRGIKAGLIVGGVALGVAGLKVFKDRLANQPAAADDPDGKSDI